VKRYVFWTLVAVLMVLAAGKVHFSREGRVYHPSDPALLSETQRPQLIEFYHRA
jgi:hypothetical protein